MKLLYGVSIRFSAKKGRHVWRPGDFILLRIQTPTLIVIVLAYKQQQHSIAFFSWPTHIGTLPVHKELRSERYRYKHLTLSSTAPPSRFIFNTCSKQKVSVASSWSSHILRTEFYLIEYKGYAYLASPMIAPEPKWRLGF